MKTSSEPDMLFFPAASFQQNDSMSDRNHILDHSHDRYYHLLLVAYYLISNWGFYLEMIVILGPCSDLPVPFYINFG